MRLATRTALAALAASVVPIVAIAVITQLQVDTELRQRVDRQLVQRAQNAPVLAAVAERLAESELGKAVEGSRVKLADKVVSLGLLPTQPLPAITRTGWQTVSADRERWRLYTVEVVDVPQQGAHTLVQVVEPLGKTEAAARKLRRRNFTLGLLGALGAGAIGYAFGLIVARPLTRLRSDTAALDPGTPASWHISRQYGAVEVDEVAAALDDNLHRLAAETERRGAALEAARGFAATAAHELRTPLQSAMTNLDIAADGRTDQATRTELIEVSRTQLQRMGSSLAAVRALADAEFADPQWFELVDLADLVDGVVADEARRAPDTVLEMHVVEGPPVRAWRDGVHLAVANVVRNALVHGKPLDGSQQHLDVRVDGASVTVADNGPGIAVAERERVMRRFERGATNAGGSGLGLAISNEVATAHGGSLRIGTSPLGGTSVVITFASGGTPFPPPQAPPL
jgi:two-component system sensor histidine kinase PrrB